MLPGGMFEIDYKIFRHPAMALVGEQTLPHIAADSGGIKVKKRRVGLR
jgi:hypothetical protein